ncbi:hypothetical protein [Aureimonas sp. AU22]|nr:hypothetical protein [Aureimonas sp. AU22]
MHCTRKLTGEFLAQRRPLVRQGLFVSLLGLALVTLVGVGIRLLVMLTVQQKRERLNRQINERLRTLIAAYKVLGGSFTGTLTVDPRHLCDLMRQSASAGEAMGAGTADVVIVDPTAWDRGRRIRDAVEASLADIILLGTEEHVRLAEKAARELVAGRPAHTHRLVASLRDFIREALDLDPVPVGLVLPRQGPAHPSGSGGRSKGDRERGDGARGGGGGGSAGGGMGGGGGSAVGSTAAVEDDPA